MSDGGTRLLLLSSTAPDIGSLTITELDSDFQPVATRRLSDAEREESFPVGNLADSVGVLIGYISRLRGGPNDLLQNPYSPYLKVLGAEGDVVRDLPLGEGGFAHVHSTLVRWGERPLVAWSKAVDADDHPAPHV